MISIGTPFTTTATRVMLLGAGELGKEVIIELQRYGVETIAVDRYPNAPGMQVADRSYVIKMLNAKALGRVVEKEKPDLIVPEVEAIATEELLKLEGRSALVSAPYFLPMSGSMLLLTIYNSLMNEEYKSWSAAAATAAAAAAGNVPRSSSSSSSSAQLWQRQAWALACSS